MARKAKTTRPVQKSGALGKLRAQVRAQQDTIAAVLEQNAEYQERVDVLDKELIELGARHGKLNQEFGYLRDVNRQLNEQQKRLREELARALAALHSMVRFVAANGGENTTREHGNRPGASWHAMPVSLVGQGIGHNNGEDLG